MAKIYSSAEAVESIAGGLIPNYHPELATARFMFAFADSGWQKGGREIWGKVKKISGLWEYVTERDFVVEVAADKWNDLTPDQRTALVDHLLERCVGEENEDGSMKWSVREPDVQEFTSILQRHQAWHSGLVDFVSVAKQIQLEEIEQQEGLEELEQVTENQTED